MSAHIEGLAVDFIVDGFRTGDECNYIRGRLTPKLPHWRIRMENKHRAGWIHCDLREPSSEATRFFIP